MKQIGMEGTNHKVSNTEGWKYLDTVLTLHYTQCHQTTNRTNIDKTISEALFTINIHFSTLIFSIVV